VITEINASLILVLMMELALAWAINIIALVLPASWERNVRKQSIVIVLLVKIKGFVTIIMDRICAPVSKDGLVIPVSWLTGVFLVPATTVEPALYWRRATPVIAPLIG
jgi:hypothetical protein